MTDEPQDEDSDVFKLLNRQTAKIGDLLDYSQSVVKVCRMQADNWRNLAHAFIECAQMANDIADDCALVARVAVDRAGDVIAIEWGIEEVNGQEEMDDDEDD